MVEQVKTKSEPRVRFRGFDDEWDSSLLLDEIEVYQPKSLPRSKFLDEGYPVYGANGMIGYYDEYNHENRQIAMACRGNTAGVVNIIPEQSYITGNAMIMDVYTNNKLDFNFMGQLFNNFDFTPYISGSGQPQITRRALKGVYIQLPSLPEQQKIGELFQSLDKSIDLSNTQVENLKQQKKALLQRLFPQKGETEPNVRLRGFTDVWEEVKLGDVLEKNTTKNKDERITNIESVSNKHGFISQSEQFENHRVASANLSNYYVVQPGMFAYNPSRINVGSIGYKDAFGDISVVSPLYEVFSAKERLDDSFFWYWLSTDVFERERINRTEGSVRDTLKYTAFSGIRTLFPSLDEQQAIGKLFQTLDEQIRLAEDKVSQYKELKRALMQRLFV